MNDKNELIQAQQTEMAETTTEGDQTMLLIQQGIQSGMTPEALEKLVALRERMLDREAKSQFIRSMGDFQDRCPTIAKRKTVKDRGERLLYKYAPLDDIVQQVRSLERDCGFSHSFNTTESERGVAVTCTVRHDGGHSEDTTIFVPNTTGHNTNAAQNQGIMVQYGMRYSFIGAFGLTTADEDADGAVQTTRPITNKQLDELEELIDLAQPDMPNLLKYLNIDDLRELPAADFERAKAALNQKIKKEGKA